MKRGSKMKWSEVVAVTADTKKTYHQAAARANRTSHQAENKCYTVRANRTVRHADGWLLVVGGWEINSWFWEFGWLVVNERSVMYSKKKEYRTTNRQVVAVRANRTKLPHSQWVLIQYERIVLYVNKQKIKCSSRDRFFFCSLCEGEANKTSQETTWSDFCMSSKNDRDTSTQCDSSNA